MRTVAIIGVGRGGEGIVAHSIGYRHAMTYASEGRCQMVGDADLDL